MKRALVMGWTDARLFLRTKVSFIWLFVVPLVFIYFMGFANRGPGDPANPRPAVLLDNQDTNFLSAIFLEELDAQGMQTVPADQAANAERGIRIPADFTRRVLEGEQAKVGLFEVKDTVSGESAFIELRLVRALIALNSHLLAAAATHGGGRTLDEAALREAQKAPASARLDARFAGRKPIPSGFNFSLPGNIVMYVMMNLLVFGGATLAAERRIGVLRRLASHAVTRLHLVAGKIYGLMLLGVVQIAVFLLAGHFLFGVNFGANLPAILLVLLVYAWIAASFGVLLASLIRAEDKVIGVCILASLLMAALGGCWWPLEIAPPMLQVIGHLLPSGWAMDALHQLISFGNGLEAVWKPLAVLAAFGLAANVLAARFFRI